MSMFSGTLNEATYPSLVRLEVTSVVRMREKAC